MTLLEVKELMVFYENAIAINNVQMKCEKGLVTGVFGANSAGKSTLMYTISGIILDVKRKEAMRGGERITVLGRVLYEGKDITQVEPSERARMGIVLCPERRRIFQESTVLENLKIGGILATKAQARKTMEYVFSLFPHLKGLKKREGGFLSGGEQQMLAIGRALMAQPKLLLLDEPLEGVAIALGAKLAESVRNLQQREPDLSILVAESDLNRMRLFTDNIFTIERGEVIQAK